MRADTPADVRGFSLVEAVVALALLGLSLPVLLSVFSDAVARLDRTEDRQLVLRRAQDLVALTTAQFDGYEGVRSGQDETTSWEIETKPFEAGRHEGGRQSAQLLPIQLAVRVRSNRGVRTRLDTMFLFREPSR